MKGGVKITRTRTWAVACAVLFGIFISTGCGPNFNSDPHDFDGPGSNTSPLITETPVITSPSDPVAGPDVHLEWMEVNGATDYYYYINYADGSGHVTHGLTSGATLADIQLQANKYSLWVRGIDGDGNGPWSTVIKFTVGAPTFIPQFIYPAAGGTTYFSTTTPTLSWTHDSSVVNYEVRAYLNGSITFSAPLDATTYCSGTSCVFDIDEWGEEELDEGQLETLYV